MLEQIFIVVDADEKNSALNIISRVIPSAAA